MRSISQIKFLLYNSLVKSHFDYCSLVLFLMSNEARSDLQKVQNRFMRLNQLIYYNLIIFIHKLTLDCPDYSFPYIKNNSNKHNYNTRNRDNLSNC
jgi:hypothetical protein